MANLPTAAQAMLDAYRELQRFDLAHPIRSRCASVEGPPGAACDCGAQVASDAADHASKALADALLTEAYGGAVCRACGHSRYEHGVCSHHYADENTCCDCAYFDEGP